MRKLWMSYISSFLNWEISVSSTLRPLRLPLLEMSLLCNCGKRPAVADELASPASPPWSPLPGERKPHGHPPPYSKDPERPLPVSEPPPPARVCGCVTLRQASLTISCLFTVIAIASLIVLCLHPGEKKFHKDRDFDTVRMAYRLFAPLAALKVLLSIMLFLGVLRERTELIKPWLISYFIVTPVEGTVFLIVSFVAMLVDMWPLAISLFISFLCYFALYGCCLYIIYCYYISIGEVKIINV